MSSPPPSLPPQSTAVLPAASATGAVAAANQGVVADPAQMPPALAKLAVSDLVAVQVLSTPAAGTVQLQTPQGPVTLKLPMALPQGAQVTLQVVVQGSLPQFRIATVDGQPVTASGQIQSAPVSSPPTVAAAPINEPLTPSAPPGIKATVLNNPSPTATPNPQALPPGTALTLQLVQVTPPATPATAPPPAPQTAPPTAPQAAQAYASAQSVVQAPPPPGLSPILSASVAPSPQEVPPAQFATPSSAPQAAPTTPAPPIPQAAPPSAPAAPPPTVTATPPTATTALPAAAAPFAEAAPTAEPSAPPAAVSQPTAAEASPAPLAAPTPTPSPAPTARAPTPAPAPTPQTAPPNASSPVPLADGDLLSGTVPASSRPASPLVETPAGLLSLQAVVDLPPGSHVDLRLVGNPTPPPAPAATPSPAAVFPDLQRALEQINLVEPQLAEQISRHLPRLGHPRLAFQLLALTSAARNGTADPLAENEEQQLLAPGKARPHGLLALLEETLSSLASPATLPGRGQDQWQSYILPLFFGDRMEQMRLVVRDPPHGKEEAAIREEQGTRFLMDLDMTNLGPVQLDGLVKGRAKRFDLIIRTHVALSEPLRLGITEVFVRTLDSFAMTGKTSFQQTPKFVEAFLSSGGMGKNC